MIVIPIIFISCVGGYPYRPLQTLSPINAVDLSSDNGLLVTGSTQISIHQRDGLKFKSIQKIQNNSTITHISLTPNKQLLLAIDTQKATIYTYNNSAQYYHLQQTILDVFHEGSMTDDGQWMALGKWYGRVEVYRFKDGIFKFFQELFPNANKIWSISLRGEYLVVGTDGYSIHIYKLNGAAFALDQEILFQNRYQKRKVVLTKNEEYLLVSSPATVYKNMPKFQLIHEYELANVSSISMSEQTKQLLISHEGGVYLYSNIENPHSHQSISTLPSTSTTISHDGNYIFINMSNQFQVYVNQHYCLDNQFYSHKNSSCLNCSEVLRGCARCANQTLCLECDQPDYSLSKSQKVCLAAVTINLEALVISLTSILGITMIVFMVVALKYVLRQKEEEVERTQNHSIFDMIPAP